MLRRINAVADAHARHEDYVNPFVDRYASRDMSWLFSPQYKFQTGGGSGWHAEAEARKARYSREQIEELAPISRPSI